MDKDPSSNVPASRPSFLGLPGSELEDEDAYVNQNRI